MKGFRRAMPIPIRANTGRDRNGTPGVLRGVQRAATAGVRTGRDIQGIGDAVGGVAENVPLGGEITGDALDAEGFDTIDVGDGDFGAFGGIAAADFLGRLGRC